MSADAVRWLYRYPEAGSPTFRLGRVGDDVIAEWVGVGTLRADLSGSRSDFCPVAGAHAGELLEHMRDAVSALVSHLRGGIALHASSVVCESLAIACLGQSGAGKSTVAARLCARPDVELASDDTTPLRIAGERITVIPAEARHWLRADVARALGIEAAARGKTSVPVARAAHREAPLVALIALAFDDTVPEPTLRPVHGRHAFELLSHSVFRFALDDGAILKCELDNLARIAAEVPMYELRRSRDLSKMDASADVVLGLVHDLAARERR